MEPEPVQPAQPEPESPFPRRGACNDRQQLVRMQRTLFDLTQDKTIPAHIRAACARAWSDLQERKRILDGKPLPGQLRPDLPPKRNRKAPAVLPLPDVAENG